MRRPSWRKRLDTLGLRWQARLEGHTVDRLAPWIVTAVLWSVLAALALARSRELSLGETMAEPMQAVWLIGEGYKPVVSLLGRNILSEQVAVLLYPIGGLASLLPTATTLLVLQAGALALGVVPLWRLAREVVRLRVGATVAVIIAYGLYAAIHATNLAGFHPETLALPALLAAVLAGFSGWSLRYWLCVGLVLAARADLGLAVAGLGALWWLEGKRALARPTALVGLGYTLVALLLIQPALGYDHPHLVAFTDYGNDNLLSVVWGMVSDPAKVLGDLFAESNFRTLVTLLAPVMFLPVVAPRYLMPALPLYALYLLADVEPGQLAEAQQTIPMTAFVFVATVFALAKIGRVLVERVNVDRRVLVAMVLTAGVFFVRDAPSSPYETPWSWGQRAADDEARLIAAALIPEGAVVRASPSLLPLLTERTGLFLLDTQGLYDEERADLAVERVNWVIFDRSAAPGWSDLDVERFGVRLEVTFQWEGPVFDRDGIQVYRLPSVAISPTENE